MNELHPLGNHFIGFWTDPNQPLSPSLSTNHLSSSLSKLLEFCMWISHPEAFYI